MPTYQQVGTVEGVQTPPPTPVPTSLNHQSEILRQIDMLLHEGHADSVTLAGKPSPDDQGKSISDLLGLNIPRGTSLGGEEAVNELVSSFNSHNSSYRQGSPLAGSHGNSYSGFQYKVQQDEFQETSSPIHILQRNLECLSLSTPPSPPSVGFSGYRGSPPFSDCDSPTLEQILLMNRYGSCSRSSSPTDSDTSINGAYTGDGVGIGSGEGGNVGEIVSCLSSSLDHSCEHSGIGILASTHILGTSPGIPRHRAQMHMPGSQMIEETRGSNSDYFWDSRQATSPLQSLRYLQSLACTPPRQYCGSPIIEQYPVTPHSHRGCAQMARRQVSSRDNSLRWPCSSPFPVSFSSYEVGTLERAALVHRGAAAVSHAACTWSGVLPPRDNRNPVYSCKVFLGGVPWDITESALIQTFRSFGSIKVEWPRKEYSTSQPKGYVYIVFDSESQVKALLQACSHYVSQGNWFFKLSSNRMKSKQVQVIPWIVSDSNYLMLKSIKLDPQKTVFVGALHGMLNAEGLANIMNDLFDGVVHAGIDTDKYKYPIGSGRVTFKDFSSYMKAVSAAFIEIKTPDFTKKVQVDPYLEDSPCSLCGLHQGPYFCREVSCFRYFCRTCWQVHHLEPMSRSHRPLMRNSKTGVAVPVI
ncbi:cytoplasmic polyadenylation element-binding protein 1-B isoform X2 [Hetaerina americana]|uniref:cytoplasmic polyadenylation element-binding protein 1-B isoform X2 n=1 Tax=Hetaerina americana TaxID=62018 RepID=UPI003A7F4D9D